MHDKISLKLTYERIWLIRKSLGVAFKVPLVVFYIIMPIFLILYWQHSVSDVFISFRTFFNQIAFLLIPFFSVWWSLLSLRERTEGDGRELFQVFRIRPSYFDAAILFVLSLIAIFVFYLVAHLVFGRFFLEYVRISMISIFFFGLMAILTQITSSITATMLVLLLYSLVSIVLSYQRFPFYGQYQEIYQTGELFAYLKFVLAGLFLAIASWLIPDRL